MTPEHKAVLADRMRFYHHSSHRAKAKATCEHCGCEFMTSRIRIYYGPVICFECRFSIFEYSHSRERNEAFRNMAVVNTPCRKKRRAA